MVGFGRAGGVTTLTPHTVDCGGGEQRSMRLFTRKENHAEGARTHTATSLGRSSC